MLLVGIVCALAASLLFYVGIALQALEARKAPRGRGLRLSLLELLLRKPLWVLGLLLGLLGVLPQVVALATAPFVAVQPLLAVGLLLLLVLVAARPALAQLCEGAPSFASGANRPSTISWPSSRR